MKEEEKDIEKEFQEGKEVQKQENIEWEELSEEDFDEDVLEDCLDEEDYAEENYDVNDYDEDDFGQEEGIVLKPWMIPAFAGMLILAILICIPLWGLTHRGKNTTSAGNGANATTESVKDVLAEANPTESNLTESLGGAEESLAMQEMSDLPSGPQGTVGQSAEPTVESSKDASASATSQENKASEAEPSKEPTAESGAASVQEPISGNESMSFQEVSDSVTAKDVTNLRSVPSTEDAENVVGQLKNGESLARTGVNHDTGWSRLNLNGETVYAVTRFLTTDLSYKTPVTPSNPNRVSTLDGRVIIFTDCDDRVTPKEYVNLRTEPSTSEGQSTVKCQVNNGESMHRTGYSADSGWSRVEYNGEVLYVVTSLVQGVTGE